MSKYIKPTFSLLAVAANSGATSNCTTPTSEAKDVMDMLEEMGFDSENAFSSYEPCQESIDFDGYCKFTSSFQIFYS